MKPDNFKIIYKILSYLEECMDAESPCMDPVCHEVLGITETRWLSILEMLQNAEYIRGVEITVYMGRSAVWNIQEMRITLKGLEYLTQNSIMQKFYKLAKGIKDIHPMT